MQDLVGLLLLMTAAIALVWLSIRARRLRNRVLKWGGIFTAAALAAVAWAFLVLASAGNIKQHGRSAPIPEVQIAGTPDQILRGQAIVGSFCAACHSKYGPLTGGMDIGKDLTAPVGSFIASNLTPAGALSDWSDGEIFRAIRNGIDAKGNWLTIMSYTNAGKLSDADTHAVIAYIRSRPPAGSMTAQPPDHLNVLGLAMLGAGLLPAGNPVFTGHLSAPPKGPTASYGEYILSYQDCRACHGANLAGGVPGQIAPIGPNLQVVRDWNKDDFIHTMRTGLDPTGRPLSELMPWRVLGKMDDEELIAVFEYLHARNFAVTAELGHRP
ncbi:MAG TPA: cytochrome c [Steroidobacteraceae bacterium]|nr:cytochrome c [Steroidobacteraceae bacterium]